MLALKANFTQRYTFIFWPVLLVLTVVVQAGLVLLPNSIWSTLISVVILFVWPGLLLTELLFSQDQLDLVEKLAIAFVLGLGLLLIPGTLLLVLRARLIHLVEVSLIINLTLAVVYVIVKLRDSPPQTQNGTVAPGLNQLHIGRRNGRVDWEMVLLSASFVILAALFLYFVSSSARIWRISDGWTYAAYVRAYVDNGVIEPDGVIFPALDSRVRLSSWLVIIALLARVSQTDLIDMYWLHLPPIFAAATLICFYALAKVLFRHSKGALFVSLVQIAWYFTSMLEDPHGRPYNGRYVLERIQEDKLFAVCIVLPIALVFALKFFKTVRLKYLAGFILAATAATIIHPMGYASLGLMIGSFALARVVVQMWQSARIKRLQLIEQRDLTAFGVLFIIIGALAAFPWLARQEYIGGGSKAFSLEDAPQGAGYVMDVFSNTRYLIMFSVSRYMASPRLINHPVIVVALLSTLVLIRYLPHDWAAQFLFSSMALPLILIYNPITAPLLGALLAAGQLWRLRWMLPIALVIGFVLYKLSKFMQQRLKTSLHPSTWESILCAIVPLLTLAGLVAPLCGLIREGVDEIIKKRNTPTLSVSPAQRDILEHIDDLLAAKSVIWVDKVMERYLPAFTSKSSPLYFRGRAIVDGDVIQDVERFKRASSLDRSVLEILDRYKVQYLLIDKKSPLAAQLPEAPSIFRLLYQNDSYQFYQVAPDLASNPVAAGDLLMIQGNFAQAANYYEQAIQTNPIDPMPYLGLARAYQALGLLEEAYTNYRHFLSLSPDKPAAAACLEMALNLDRSFAIGYILRGESYQTPPDPNTAYNFLDHLDNANKVSPDNTTYIRRSAFIIDQFPKGVIFQHAPAQIVYHLSLPVKARLSFGIALAPAVWQPGKGDGVQFDIYIDDGHARRNVFSRYIDPKNIPADRRWHDYKVDLSAWAGQTVTITFATGCGPNDNCDYDWAGWGEPRIVQPIAYNFLDHFSTAEQVTQGLGEVRVVTQTIDYEPRPLLFQHPSSQVAYSLTLPLQSTLYFGYGMAPEVWSPDKGDGVEYNIYVQRPEEPYTLYQVFHRIIDPKNNPEDRRWFDERVDLSRFGGQTVKIIFEALPGPAGNANYDWGGWSAPVLVDETLPGENIAGPTAPSRNVP